MSADIVYCLNRYHCKLNDKCKRSDYPKEIRYLLFSNFYNVFKKECEYFIDRFKK